MYIEIENRELFDAVRSELETHDAELVVLNHGDGWKPEYAPGSGVNIVVHTGVVPRVYGHGWARWAEMFMAAKGARSWDENFSMSPTHAGTEPKEIRDVILDAQFAEGKAAYAASFGVNYIGRVNIDPRTIVLVDYKGDKTLNPDHDVLIENLLTSLPEDKRTFKTETSWTSFGVASSGNVDKLRDFLDYYEQTNILAYSDGAKAKLRHLGRDFAEVEVPVPDEKYGKSLRAAASSLRPWA